jgi:NADH-quinone oxidoreductase subunit G
MSEMVNLTIDGVELAVPKGMLVVDAAKRIDVDIPVFCYHPKLNPVGMCRMCLVEIGLPVIDRATNQKVLNPDGSVKLNFGKGLQTGCTVVVSEGMVVRTATVPVQDAREDIIEFILTSHPLDCPICDKGGECPLQNLTMAYGRDESRMFLADKMKLAKHVPLGELIVLDRERCIQCARCTRFQAEIVDDPVIHFHNRGRRLEIVTFTDPGFDSYWSGNTTDICPVGALTSSDFRFEARPWELNPVASICPHCPVGCNTTMSTRREAVSGGRNVIKRIMPRQNEAVNEIWICDKGRYVHHFADAPERLTRPLVRRDGRLEPVSWDDALDYVAGKLQQHKHAAAGIAGERLSNEDYFQFQRLFRQGLGSGNLDLAERRLAGGDVVAQVGLSRGSNLKDLKKGDAILVVAADLHEEAPVWWLRVKQAAERGATLVTLNARATRLEKFARHARRYAPGGVLAAARELLTLAHVDTGAAEADSAAAVAAALVEAENLVIFYGAEGLTYEETDTLARMLGNLLLLKRGESATAPTEGDTAEAVPAEAAVERAHAGRPNNGLVPVWSHGNTQGAWDMGIHPAFAPGYAAATNRGQSAADIYAGAADGRVEALFVLGADPVGDGLLRDKPGFLVVQELFLTATAEMADVVLPAQSWAEREGTYTNGERRVQRFYPAIPSMGEARPDWQILAQIGERVGLGKPPFAAALVFKEIAAAVPPYKGLDYRALAHVEPQWPIVGGPDLYFGGTAYDNKQGLGQQWATAAEAAGLPSYELPIDGPAGLGGGGLRVMRIPALYTPGTLIDFTDLLNRRMARPTLYLNPADAGAYAEGEPLSVAAGGERFDVVAAISEAAPAGLGLLCGAPGAHPLGIEPAIVSRRPVADMAAAD